MTNTTQKPAPCGSSDNYWNKAFDSATPAVAAVKYKDGGNNWNARFDKGAGGRTRGANGVWNPPPAIGSNAKKPV